MKRYFNTSGPNNPRDHYTLMREDLVKVGLDYVEKERYFTIWAPRQTGKSTYFRLLSERLKQKDYLVTHINTENFLSATESSFLKHIIRKINESASISIEAKIFSEFSDEIEKVTNKRFVLIVDEVEGLNPDIFGQFLHTIRNLYHSRESHCLKSVILVGVSNIVGIVQDNASPFNIADNLEVPYFNESEVFELLLQHEHDTGQKFDQIVIEKICQITACQPGLVNGFAYHLVEKNKKKKIITYDDFLDVEDWYLRKAIDKNVSNIINKAKKYKKFIEELLYTEAEIPFDIDREAVRILHINGLLKENNAGNVEFWVPLYKKRLYKAFYPYMNGESKHILQQLFIEDYFKEDGTLKIEKFIINYREYVKRRNFKYFRERDKVTGEYTTIKEAALVYSFETYIQSFLQEAEGKSYLEAHTGAGRSDLLININNKEYIIEAKVYRSPKKYQDGKKQLAYYCKSINLKEGIYLVFIANNIKLHPSIKEDDVNINNIIIKTFLIFYDEEKDF